MYNIIIIIPRVQYNILYDVSVMYRAVFYSGSYRADCIVSCAALLPN
jgi:hypothetical protein